MIILIAQKKILCVDRVPFTLCGKLPLRAFTLYQIFTHVIHQKHNFFRMMRHLHLFQIVGRAYFWLFLLKIRCRALQIEMSIHVGLNLLFFNTSILCIKYSLITIILYHRPMPKMTCSFDSISWPGIGPDQCNSTTFHIETFYQDLGPPYISPRNGLIFS